MRFKSAIIALAAVALSVTGLSASASADTTGTVLKIVEVGTDAMGADSFANRNREFVKVQNVSAAAVDVAGVLFEDNWAHARTLSGDTHSCNTYKVVDLPDNATTLLQPGEYLTIFNGVRFGGNRKIVNGSVVEYQLFANSDVDCGTFGQYFNNDADQVWVTNATGGTVYSSKSWDWNGGYTIKQP